MHTFFRILLAATAATVVVACGGGGDGGTPVTPTTDITADNAMSITQEVMATTAAALAVGDQVGFGALSASASAYSENHSLASVISMARAYLPGDLISVQAAAVTPQALVPCDFGGYVDVDELSNTVVRLSFTECDGFSDSELGLEGVINGVMKLTLNDINPPPVLDISVELTGFSISGFTDAIEADGKFNLRIEDLTGAGEFYHYKTMLDFNNFIITIEDESVGLLRYIYSLEEKYSDAEDWIKEDFSGSLDGVSFTGIVNFNTVIPFKFDFDTGYYTEGDIFISGSDGQEIHLAVVPGSDNLIVEIDVDGDGTYDLFPDWTWSDIGSI